MLHQQLQKQRQTEIDDYEAKLQGYKNTADSAKQGKKSILDQLSQQEATYTPTQTRYIDVNTGDVYLLHPATGEYKNITQIFKNASRDQQRDILHYMKDFDERLLDNSSGTPKVINAFDEATSNFIVVKIIFLILMQTEQGHRRRLILGMLIDNLSKQIVI